MTKRKPDAQPRGEPWSAREIATAARIWREQMTEPATRGEAIFGRKNAVCQAIGDAIGRTVYAVKGRFRDHGVAFISPAAASCGKPDPARLEPETALGRDALAHARARQSPIAAMLGDPPPGYSALDQRRAS